MQLLNPNSEFITTRVLCVWFCHIMFGNNSLVLTFISTKKTGHETEKGEGIRKDLNEPLGPFIWHRMIKTSRRRKNYPHFLAIIVTQSSSNQGGWWFSCLSILCQRALEQDAVVLMWFQLYKRIFCTLREIKADVLFERMLAPSLPQNRVI